jgi:hypothetical protein
VLKIVKDQGVDTHNLDWEIMQLHVLKEQALAASTAVQQQEEKVIDLLRLEGKKTYKARAVNYRATLVQGTRTKYNEAGLKKALGAPLWKKVIKTSLDTKKLEELVKDGEIDIHVVAENSEVLDNKPYVRVSPLTEDDDE